MLSEVAGGPQGQPTRVHQSQRCVTPSSAYTRKSKPESDRLLVIKDGMGGQGVARSLRRAPTTRFSGVELKIREQNPVTDPYMGQQY